MRAMCELSHSQGGSLTDTVLIVRGLPVGAETEARTAIFRRKNRYGTVCRTR